MERRDIGHHSLLKKIWNVKDIPQDWKLGLLVELPNQMVIMLLTIASKVLSKNCTGKDVKDEI